MQAIRFFGLTILSNLLCVFVGICLPMKTLTSWILSCFFMTASVCCALPAKEPSTTPTPPPIKIPDPGPVIGLPGQTQIFPKQYAGQLKVSDCGNYTFFWFFDSQYSPNDPVVLWLNGGPGASSMIGLFQENGPLMLNQAEDGGLNVKARPTSWNNNAHYLVIDQPVGTGLSFSKDSDSCAPQNENESTEQLYLALQEFFSLYTDYADNDFYIFGESFGGHYIPRITDFIIDANNGNQISKAYSPNDIKFNLKGVGIGDGWVDPETQNADVAKFAYEHGLITETQQKELQATIDTCEQQLHKYDNNRTMNGTEFIPASVGHLCDAVSNQLSEMTGLNIYNMTSVEGYGTEMLTKYLNLASVRSALHVSESTPPWVAVNNIVAGKFEAGDMNSMVEFIGDILTKSAIRVLVYEGQLDGCCGPGGANSWLRKMARGYWPMGKDFILAPYRPWYVGGVRSGQFRTYPVGQFIGNAQLAETVFYNAGHLVPMDQPEHAFSMFNEFIGTQTSP